MLKNKVSFIFNTPPVISVTVNESSCFFLNATVIVSIMLLLLILKISESFSIGECQRFKVSFPFSGRMMV